MTSLPVPGHCQPLGSASNGLKVLHIIFDVKLEILTPTYLYLDIREGIPKCDLPICNWLAFRISLQRPPNARYYFWSKKWNPELTNLYLVIHEGIPQAGSKLSKLKKDLSWFWGRKWGKYVEGSWIEEVRTGSESA